MFPWSEGTNTWVPRGGAIVGEAAFDWAGLSVALSADGTVLAIGAPYNDDGGVNAGHARAFRWSDGTNTWVPRGGAIDGAAGDRAGRSVALSGNGTILAVGAP